MLTFVKDLEMKPNKTGTKRRMYRVLCSGCGKTHVIQAGQFKSGYSNWCKPCGIKSKKNKVATHLL